jgi:hypothetical protein
MIDRSRIGIAAAILLTAWIVASPELSAHGVSSKDGLSLLIISSAHFEAQRKPVPELLA